MEETENIMENLMNRLVASPDLLDLARSFKFVCDRHNVPLKAAALQFGAIRAVLSGRSIQWTHCIQWVDCIHGTPVSRGCTVFGGCSVFSGRTVSSGGTIFLARCHHSLLGATTPCQAPATIVDQIAGDQGCTGYA